MEVNVNSDVGVEGKEKRMSKGLKELFESLKQQLWGAFEAIKEEYKIIKSEVGKIAEKAFAYLVKMGKFSDAIDVRNRVKFSCKNIRGFLSCSRVKKRSIAELKRILFSGDYEKALDFKKNFRLTKKETRRAVEGAYVKKIRERDDNFFKPSDYAYLLRELSNFYPKILDDDKLPDIKWGPMYRRLMRLFTPSSREEYDPWKQELDHLVSLMTPITLNKHKTKDAEIVFNFVKEFGMFNMPTIFGWYAYISRANEIKDIPKQIKDEINKSLRVNIDTLPNKGFVIKEIKSLKDKIRTAFLRDKIPTKIMQTEAGIEILFSLVGFTDYRSCSKAKEIIEEWGKVSKKRPKLAKLEKGYREMTINVPLVSRNEKLSVASDKEKEIISNSELQLFLEKLRKSYLMALEIETDKDWWKEKKISFLSNIESEIRMLEERLKKLPNEIAITQVKAKIDQLKNIGEFLLRIDLFGNPNKKDSDLTAFLNELSILLPLKTIGRDDLLRSVSAFHSFLFMTDDQKLGIVEKVKSHNGLWSKDEVVYWGEFFESFLHGKYFQENLIINPLIPKNLLKDLEMMWGMKEIDKNILVIKNNELKSLYSERVNLPKNTVEVTLVPAKGILRIYSGDVGDACYSWCHQELASGKFPKLTSFIYVTGRQTKDEKLVGSVLVIEAKTPGGKGVLLVRANNPLENFLRKVDVSAFMNLVLEEMKKLASVIGKEIVVVPLDPASGSASNRSQVTDYYLEKFGNNKKIALRSTAETNFNSFENWNRRGDRCVVKIN